MNYWQKELKHLDFTEDLLPQLQAEARRLSYADSSLIGSRTESLSEDRIRPLHAVLDRLRDNEEKLQMLYKQVGDLLKENTEITKQLHEALHDQEPASIDKAEQSPRVMQPLTMKDISSGDIIRVHYHIWQDYYYIVSKEEQGVYGYKLNKNMLIRRKSKAKRLSLDVLKYGKIVQSQVMLEDVKAAEEWLQIQTLSKQFFTLKKNEAHPFSELHLQLLAGV